MNSMILQTVCLIRFFIELLPSLWLFSCLMCFISNCSDRVLISLLLSQRPKFLRANGKIYQAINADTLRAQNMETWPFFNQATANLVPLNARRVAVKFDSFTIASLIPIKNRGSGRGELEITYLDEELRISRGNQGNLFILRMVDPSYRVPL
ncbi:probable plastid-lipid-associated protein 4, chloroplastic [Solanum stenotomum]|uniref:probable plastid-lipid-associated protein 4, chloroplastic n=1 Tax=Solanum stenotomum TaxID=172797 RepID=UPI0020D1CF87|nr:probable plastid-lipid-associated protein 4, chloroplastic [Solanum stenotomum]